HGYLQLFAENDPPTDIAVMVGELRTSVETLTGQMDDVMSRLDSLENQRRWTEEEIRDLYNSMYQVRESVEAVEAVAEAAADAAADAAAEAATDPAPSD